MPQQLRAAGLPVAGNHNAGIGKGGQGLFHSARPGPHVGVLSVAQIDGLGVLCHAARKKQIFGGNPDKDAVRGMAAAQIDVAHLQTVQFERPLAREAVLRRAQALLPGNGNSAVVGVGRDAPAVHGGQAAHGILVPVIGHAGRDSGVQDIFYPVQQDFGLRFGPRRVKEKGFALVHQNQTIGGHQAERRHLIAGYVHVYPPGQPDHVQILRNTGRLADFLRRSLCRGPPTDNQGQHDCPQKHSYLCHIFLHTMPYHKTLPRRTGVFVRRQERQAARRGNVV